MEQQGPSFALADGVLARRVEEEMVLLDLKTEQYYGLDAVGADVVNRLTSAPRQTALAALREHYGVSAGVLEADVERLVEELIDAGLLRRTMQS